MLGHNTCSRPTGQKGGNVLSRRSFLILTASQAGLVLVPRARGQTILAHSGTECEADPALKIPEMRLGYHGFMHCDLHGDYQVAFAKWKCMCYTGQCRPTKFRHLKRKSDQYVDYEIYVDGEYYPIPKAAFRTEKADMSAALLRWSAHACANKGPNPHIECAWINLSS